MSNTAIKIENVSKLYRLGKIGTGSFQHDVNRWWHTVRGKEDPYMRLGEENDRTTKGNSEYVWALKDISFEVQRGDVLGIIGKNGAGKSTLLKLLSRTTSPTKGSIKIKGRIASLLEVGTGFHPELTGRENIFLNGAILGMSKSEIRQKFDEIVDFSGVEKYIDTPVKRYSSGMYVRLAFGVAAHLEPELLIVDEVLAVGDMEFQKKCLGKMRDVSQNQERTILFVSHNMLAVKSLCRTGLFLEKGRIKVAGKIEEVVHNYMSSEKSVVASFVEIEKKFNGFTVHSIAVNNNGITGHFNIEEELAFDVKVSGEQDYESINVNLFFKNSDDVIIFASCSEPEFFSKGEYNFRCVIPRNTLNDIQYTIDLMIVKDGTVILHNLKDILLIEGIEKKRESAWLGKFPGMIRPTYYPWTKNRIHAFV